MGEGGQGGGAEAGVIKERRHAQGAFVPGIHVLLSRS